MGRADPRGCVCLCVCVIHSERSAEPVLPAARAECRHLEGAHASVPCQAAAKLFEEEQKIAQQKKLEELEAMSRTKRSELAQNLGGSIKHLKIKIDGNQRDDWDVFQGDPSEKLKRLAQLDNTVHLSQPVRHDVDIENVNYFTRIQNAKESTLENLDEEPASAYFQEPSSGEPPSPTH